MPFLKVSFTEYFWTHGRHWSMVVGTIIISVLQIRVKSMMTWPDSTGQGFGTQSSLLGRWKERHCWTWNKICLWGSIWVERRALGKAPAFWNTGVSSTHWKVLGKLWYHETFRNDQEGVGLSTVGQDRNDSGGGLNTLPDATPASLPSGEKPRLPSLRLLAPLKEGEFFLAGKYNVQGGVGASGLWGRDWRRSTRQP